MQAIQVLLTSMRQSTSFGKDFQDTVSSITTIVDNLVVVSRRTLSLSSANEYREDGESILEDLSKANINLSELGNSIIDQPQSKSIKQKLASSAYDIAKFVKELIGLIE